MIYNLPPLPEPYHGFYATPMYSPEQMRAYAKAALDALADEAEASIKAMIEEGLGQLPKQKPVAWQAVGGSIWGHKTSENDRPLYTEGAWQAQHCAQPAASGEPLAWVRVIDEALVCSHLDVADQADDYATAKRKLNNLLAHEQSIGAYFAAQPAPAPLTDEQIDQITAQQWGAGMGAPYAAYRAYARAVEAAHGITAKEAP